MHRLRRVCTPLDEYILINFDGQSRNYTNSPDFSAFGNSTDGGCPWTEYYDLEKMQALVGSKYKLVDVSKWGHQSIEFVNYEFVKEA